MIHGGSNVFHVKELLGHETLRTMRHYARLTIVDLKKTHGKCTQGSVPKMAENDPASCYHVCMNARVIIDPAVCHGQPCIKGTRIMVSNILNLLAHGASA